MWTYPVYGVFAHLSIIKMGAATLGGGYPVAHRGFENKEYPYALVRFTDNNTV